MRMKVVLLHVHGVVAQLHEWWPEVHVCVRVVCWVRGVCECSYICICVFTLMMNTTNNISCWHLYNQRKVFVFLSCFLFSLSVSHCFYPFYMRMWHGNFTGKAVFLPWQAEGGGTVNVDTAFQVWKHDIGTAWRQSTNRWMTCLFLD